MHPDVSGKQLPAWHKAIEAGSEPAAADNVVEQLKISDNFDKIISGILTKNREWIPPANTANSSSLVLKMRQQLAGWETLFRYRAEKAPAARQNHGLRAERSGAGEGKRSRRVGGSSTPFCYPKPNLTESQ